MNATSCGATVRSLPLQTGQAPSAPRSVRRWEMARTSMAPFSVGGRLGQHRIRTALINGETACGCTCFSSPALRRALLRQSIQQTIDVVVKQDVQAGAQLQMPKRRELLLAHDGLERVLRASAVMV